MRRPGSLPVRHVLRAVRRMPVRLLMMVLICATTFGVTAGGYSALESLRASVAGGQARADLAELELWVATDDARNLPSFEDIEGLRSVERRLLAHGKARLGNGPPVSALYVGADPAVFDRINRLRALAGSLQQVGHEDAVAVERSCAAHHRVGLGDTVPLRAGASALQVRVVAIVDSPEFLVAPANPGAYVPTPGSLCVFFGAERPLHQALGFDAFNSLLFRFDEGALERIRPLLIARAESRLAVDQAVSRAEQFSRRFLDMHLESFRVFMPALIGVFALASVLVVLFLMGQWIRAERPVIAMLLTLGFGRRQVVAAYLLPAAGIAVAALLVGIGIAFIDLHILGEGYAQAVGMASPQLALEPRPLGAAAALVGLAIALAMLSPIRTLLRVAPAEAVREADVDDSPRVQRLAQRIRAPLWLGFPLRNLLRGWRVTAASTGAFAAILAAVIACYVCVSSIERMVIEGFAGDRWAAVIDLDVPAWPDELEALQAAGGIRAPLSPFVKGHARLDRDGRLDPLRLLGIEPGVAKRTPYVLRGRDLAPGDVDAAVLDSRVATTHGLRVGDRVPIVALGVEHRITLVGIHASDVPGGLIVPLELGQRILDLEGRASGAFVPGDVLPAGALAALRDAPQVIRASVRDEVAGDVIALSRQLVFITHQSAAAAIVVALLLLAASSAFAIVGRRADYATLRVLGHPDRTVARIVVTEVTLVAAVAGVLSAPLGLLVGDLLNRRLGDVWFHVLTGPYASDFLAVIVPAVLLAPVVALPSLRAVLAAPPVAVLGERRFG